MSSESSGTVIGLDDTLHAVVQVTHEHGLPLHGASAHAGRVQVFTDPVDLPWWVRWLTDPVVAQPRWVVWAKEADGEVALHVSGHREGIEWSVVDHVPVEVAIPVLAAHGVTVSAEHLRVPAAAAVALADAFADHAAASGGERS